MKYKINDKVKFYEHGHTGNIVKGVLKVLTSWMCVGMITSSNHLMENDMKLVKNV